MPWPYSGAGSSCVLKRLRIGRSKSIDNNTKALEDLTGLINEMRVAQASVETNITNLWHRYKDLKGEVDRIHDHNRDLGNPPCSKK